MRFLIRFIIRMAFFIIVRRRVDLKGVIHVRFSRSKSYEKKLERQFLGFRYLHFQAPLIYNSASVLGARNNSNWTMKLKIGGKSSIKGSSEDYLRSQNTLS